MGYTLNYLKKSPVYYFEGADGKIVTADEKVAVDMYYKRSNWARQDFKLIGYSDGSIVYNELKKQALNQTNDKKAVAEAFAKQLEEAKKTPTPPNRIDVDIFTPNASGTSRETIIKEMGSKI